MTNFVMLDYNGQPVTDWDFDGTQTWNIYPVAPETKGTPRAVFSLLVRNHDDAETAVSILGDLNRGEDLSCLEAFSKGKVSTNSQWRALSLGLGGGNQFEIQRPRDHLLNPVDKARHLGNFGYSETWHIVVNNEFKGTQRPVFSFVVKGAWEADLVLDTVKILNRSDRPNIAQCPFFCKGKVSSKKDVDRFAEWMAKNSKPEAIALSAFELQDRGQK